MNRLGLFAIVFLVLLIPSTTNRRSVVLASTDSIRFAVIGDYGTGDAHEAAVATQVKSWNPDFIITVGDNNYPLGEQVTIDDHIGKDYAEFIYPYTGAYTSTVTVNRFFPTLGNHDWYTYTIATMPYLNYFTLDGNERYYDFVRGVVHFFALDSDPSEPDGNTSSSTQATWLRNQLAASTSCWNLVYLHHAPYSSGPHGADPYDQGRNMTWSFKAWGADAVFAGHDHDYERIDVGGIPYFVDGSGGAGLYSLVQLVTGSQFFDSSHWGAMRVTATSTQLTYEFIATDGVVWDTYVQNGGCSIFFPLVMK